MTPLEKFAEFAGCSSSPRVDVGLISRSALVQRHPPAAGTLTRSNNAIAQDVGLEQLNGDVTGNGTSPPDVVTLRAQWPDLVGHPTSDPVRSKAI